MKDSVRCSNVRLMVDDYEACFLFYRDVVGFSVLYGDEESRYAELDMGTGTHLALNKREVMAEAFGTLHADAKLPGQDRFALILETDDVDATAARLRDAGAAVVKEPQDWPGWGIRAAHFRDPDGYLVEVNSPLPDEG
ncbi:VOC family protein [Streptomyces sp. SP18CM02]|uniref:VOC family protein n=1 Tax=Streptomyces sp. SP18CM02 TaxID=2758571 RepID=UPI00295EE7B8|nr:VOC family protein [Streptomyces sp. SP18CM02]